VGATEELLLWGLTTETSYDFFQDYLKLDGTAIIGSQFKGEITYG